MNQEATNQAPPCATRVSVILSWSPCLRSVNATIKKPIPRSSPDRTLDQYRPFALPNPILCPCSSTTLIPSIFLPMVAYQLEDSAKVNQSHCSKNPEMKPRAAPTNSASSADPEPVTAMEKAMLKPREKARINKTICSKIVSMT